MDQRRLEILMLEAEAYVDRLLERFQLMMLGDRVNFPGQNEVNDGAQMDSRGNQVTQPDQTRENSP